MFGLIGVLLPGFLGRDEVAARGLVFFVGRPPVRGDVTETLGGRTFLDFGGTLVRDTGLIMALHSAPMCGLVALVRTLGVFGGTLHVVGGDGLSCRQLLPPAQQLLGALGGLVTCCLSHETTVDRLRRQSGVVLARRLRVG